MYNLLTGAAGAAIGAVGGPVGMAIGAIVGTLLAGTIGILSVKAIKQNNATIEQKENKLKDLENTLNQIDTTIANNQNQDLYTEPHIEDRSPNATANKNADENEKIDQIIEEMQQNLNLPNKNAIVQDTTTTINPTPNEPNNTVENEIGKGVEPVINGLDNIEDKTKENLIQNVTTNWEDTTKWWEDQQKKVWEREDQIRKEVQEREDTAYERAIESLRRAGVNPNLLSSITPAASGGGLYNASQIDTSTLTTQMNIDLEKMQQMIDQAFEGDENAKNRFTDVFSGLLSNILMMVIMKG